MSIPYTYVDAGVSKAASGRAVGATTLTVTTGEGSKFGAPTVGAPLRLAVWRSGGYITTLQVTGVSADTLTIAGAMDGHADAAVLAGDDLVASATKGDFEALWTQIASLFTMPASMSITSAGPTDTISSSNTEIVLQQTGDTYGTVRFRLQNRNGSNGMVVENVGVALCDLAFIAGGVQKNLRFETRFVQTMSGSSEIQLINPTAAVVNAAFGDSKSYIFGGLIVGPTSIRSSVTGGSNPPLAELDLRGGFRKPRGSITTTYYLIKATDGVVCVDALTAAVTMDLPTGAPSGLQVTVKDCVGAAATYNITIKAPTGKTIDGASTAVINTNYGSFTFVADGADNFAITGKV